MKKIITISLFIINFINLNAQHQDFTINTLTIASSKHFLVSYEHIFESDRSLGLQVGFGKTDEVFLDDFSITPYYRYYYGEDANLFFIEVYLKGSYYKTGYEKNYTGIAAGVGFGLKFKIAEHFLLGFNIGSGYNYTKVYNDQISKRGSLFIGYRL